MWYEPFADRLERDASLRELTSVRVGGTARWLVRPADEAEAGRLLRALHAEGLPHRILGGGSNTLPHDGTVEEVVIHCGSLKELDVRGSRLVAGAGCVLSSVIARANGLGLGGMHVLAGIPGQLGGAVAMNAGGRYGEIGPLVESVRVCLRDGSLNELAGADLGFGYRTSHLPPGALITSVVLRLEPVDDPSMLRRETGRIIREKNAVQPTRAWNFGCMFKNPPEGSAGMLVDRAGLRGAQRGGARISPLHGNFVENLGEARAADIRELMELAAGAVRERFQVELEPEVRTWEEPRSA